MNKSFVMICMMGLLLLSAAMCASPSRATMTGQPAALEETSTPTPTPAPIYLPALMNGSAKMLGFIEEKYWNKENVEQVMPQIDALTYPKRHSAVGWYIDIQDPAFVEDWETESALNRNNFYRQLEQLWLKGYTSFVKIYSREAVSLITKGSYDSRITQAANIYKRWIEQGEGRKAMLAPLQEMNGDWVPYYPKDAPVSEKQKQYKAAYRYFVAKFIQAGVGRSQVWWTFAANGMSVPDIPENGFEYYYPGADVVDVVGFASYNFGYCAATYVGRPYDVGRWENYDKIFEPYIRRMEAMAPGKPIIITETGSSALFTAADRPDHYNLEKKREWFNLNYAYLAKQPSVLGIFYFNLNEFEGTSCDFKIPTSGFEGYREAAANREFQYIPGNELWFFIP